MRCPPAERLAMQDLHELAGEHFLATLQALAGELEEDASMTREKFVETMQ